MPTLMHVFLQDVEEINSLLQAEQLNIASFQTALTCLLHTYLKLLRKRDQKEQETYSRMLLDALLASKCPLAYHDTITVLLEHVDITVWGANKVKKLKQLSQEAIRTTPPLALMRTHLCIHRLLSIEEALAFCLKDDLLAHLQAIGSTSPPEEKRKMCSEIMTCLQMAAVTGIDASHYGHLTWLDVTSLYFVFFVSIFKIQGKHILKI